MLEVSNIIRDNVLKNMTEGVLVLGTKGTILLANDAACEMLGYSEETLLGMQFISLVMNASENDEFLQTVLDAYFDQDKSSSSIVPYFKDGVEHTLRVVATVMKDPGGKIDGTILVIENLSELVWLRDEVKTKRQIEELNTKLELRNKLLNETFGKFLSDEIVKQLLDTPGGLDLGGKKQYLTIMMSDLRGFTAISERMDPSDLVSMLNHYLGVMTEVIQRRGGTIIEFIGDGIMAIFGAPDASDTHAGDAVAAAIEMEAAMDGINDWNITHGYPLLKMGIGIVTGDMIIGNIGSTKRMKYGVVGSNVNLCGRIESYTTAGQILISPETRKEIQAELTVAREIRVMPKGAVNEIVLSQVTEIGAPYNASMETEYSALVELHAPAPIAFYKLEGKHEMEKPYYGGIVSVGSDSAVLETDSELKVLDNIQFDAGGKLFGKVVDIKENRYMLHYTYIPVNYHEWFTKITKEDAKA